MIDQIRIVCEDQSHYPGKRVVVARLVRGENGWRDGDSMTLVAAGRSPIQVTGTDQQTAKIDLRCPVCHFTLRVKGTRLVPVLGALAGADVGQVSMHGLSVRLQ